MMPPDSLICKSFFFCYRRWCWMTEFRASVGSSHPLERQKSIYWVSLKTLPTQSSTIGDWSINCPCHLTLVELANGLTACNATMICIRFQELGLEKGWGDTAKRVLDTLHLLLDLLEAPDPANLEKFLGTIPMMFNVVILSPHGYFAQSNVLGYPDTGGQVQNLSDYFSFSYCSF